MILSILGAALAVGAMACTEASGDTSARRAETPSTQQQAAPAARSLSADERALYTDMARSAWSYLDQYYQPGTGLVNGTPDWPNTTLWDLGGQLLATHAAKELGLLPAAEYEKRTRTTLATLERMPLFRNVAFSKQYSTKDASIASARSGWSATDLGRLLAALKIVAVREPQFAAQAERIARRNDFKQIVRGGYLHGQHIGSSGKPWTFQEGRIGYEQYVARGFSEWGADVRNALSVRKNAQPVKVMGVELLQDRRFQDRLLSEPFILYGLEFGWPEDYRVLAVNLLKVQEARYKATGRVTIASEDALSVKPHYFYYYCVYCNRKPFVIDISTPGRELDSPRWVSTKGAFGWHALLPNDYTRTAVEYVARAKDARRGYATGVFEGTGESTQTWDVNTAAVLLEIAYFQLRGGKPLILP